MYKRWQPLYDDIKGHVPNIEFVQGLLDDLNKDTFLDVSRRTLVVIDDMMRDAADNNDVCEIFVEGAHHRNLSVALIMQNLFNKGKGNRTMNLNTQYLVLFKNPRDQQQIATLARQMYPGKSRKLIDAYQKAVEIPHGSLVIDFKQLTPDDQRIRPNVFQNNQDHSTYKNSDFIEQTDSYEKRSVYEDDIESEFNPETGSVCDDDIESECSVDTFEDNEDDTSGFDMLINKIWGTHDSIFQEKMTYLVNNGMEEAEARNLVRENMMEMDRELLLNLYSDFLNISILLMKSSLHKRMRHIILSEINRCNVSVEHAISRILMNHKNEFNVLFLEN